MHNMKIIQFAFVGSWFSNCCCWSFFILYCRKGRGMHPPAELAACTCLSLMAVDRLAPLSLSCSAWTLQRSWIWNGEWRVTAVSRFLRVHFPASSGATCPCPDGPCWEWQPPPASCSSTLCGRVRWEGMVGSDGLCVFVCLCMCVFYRWASAACSLWAALRSGQSGCSCLWTGPLEEWTGTGSFRCCWVHIYWQSPVKPCSNLCRQQWPACGLQWLCGLRGRVLLCWRRSNATVPVESPWLWGLDHSLLLLGHTADLFWYTHTHTHIKHADLNSAFQITIMQMIFFPWFF